MIGPPRPARRANEEVYVTTTVENAPGTPVAIGGTRGGPDKPTLRRDRWWVEPVVTVTILTAFVVYSTWAAFIGKNYYAGRRAEPEPDLALLLALPDRQLRRGEPPLRRWIDAWHITPALLILIFPLGFRLTCYYYRKAYYRSFWWSPPACAVADAHGSYSGETPDPVDPPERAPLLLLDPPPLQRHPHLRRRRGLPPTGSGHRHQRGHGDPVPQRHVPLALQHLAATPAAISAAAR